MMETIQAKINELLDVSREDIFTKEKRKDFQKNFDRKLKKQESLIAELIVLARKEKTLLGRVIKFPRGDGYALYLITSVGKKTVQLKWLDYCDQWVDDRCGYACRLDINYAQSQINFNDKWSDMAEARRLETAKKTARELNKECEVQAEE
jgi:transcription elongation factor Elf1